MRIPLLLVAFACVTNSARAADQPQPTPQPTIVKIVNAEAVSLPEPTKDALAVADGLNTFAWDMYRQLKTKPGNLFYSPFSIHSALNMTGAGAGGKTAAEFATVLHTLPDEQASHAGAAFLTHRHQQAKDYELAIANRLFGRQDEPFKAPFLALCKDVYQAPLDTVTFPEPGRSQINDWVKQRTKEHIKELIPVGGVDDDTAMVLVNATYFKGMWAGKFDQARTADGPFTVSADKQVTVPFMYRYDDDLRMVKLKSATMVELPYAGEELAMDVIIPHARDGLAAVEQQMDAKNLEAAIAGLRSTTVELQLPRFSVRWGTVSLKESLIALGMTTAFDPGLADFSRMSDKGMVISKVYHQAFVAVDEAGTEAAAATSVVMKPTSARMPIRIKADRPFLFLIRDVKTKAVLFMGRVIDPS